MKKEDFLMKKEDFFNSPAGKAIEVAINLFYAVVIAASILGMILYAIVVIVLYAGDYMNLKDMIIHSCMILGVSYLIYRAIRWSIEIDRIEKNSIPEDIAIPAERVFEEGENRQNDKM